MPNLKLRTSDLKELVVDVAVAKKSGTLKSMIDNFGIDETEQEVIPLPKVHSAIMKKVLEWCEKFKSVENIEDSSPENHTEWVADFFKVDQGMLMALIETANYLEVKDLLESSCLAVANMIRGQSPEEIRRTFNIVNDLPN